MKTTLRSYFVRINSFPTMSQLPVDGASCDTSKKASKVGNLCPAVAMVRYTFFHVLCLHFVDSIFASSDFKKGFTAAMFLMESIAVHFDSEFPRES